MSATDVSIANLALQILGVSTKIEALDQDNPNAREINSCFDSLREELLRQFPWNFAKTRVVLPALAAQTAWGNFNQFQLPVDCLRFLRPTDRQVDWELEASAGGAPVLVTKDVGPLQIRYIQDVTDPSRFDAEFVQMLAARIAQQCAQPITSSTEKQQIADRAFATAQAKARNANAFERAADQAIPDDYFVVMGNAGSVNQVVLG